jgi:hypothetical protein
MIFFDKTRTIGQDANGKNVVWVSIYVDTAANLPTYNDYQSDGFILCMASEGRCIDTGDLYRLDSAGEWQLSQAGTGTYTKSEIDTLLNAKQDVLTFDSTPTQGSTNPVTSGGVWTDQKRQDMLQDEDRAALVELIDSGAKNLAVPLNLATRAGLTITNNKGQYTISGTTTSEFTGYLFRPAEPLQITTDCVIIGAEQLTGLAYCAAYSDSAGSSLKFEDIGTKKILPSGAVISYIYVQQRTVGTAVSANINLMLCTAADYAISPKFVPYRPTWQEMYDMILALQSGGNRALTMQIQPTEDTEPFWGGSMCFGSFGSRYLYETVHDVRYYARYEMTGITTEEVDAVCRKFFPPLPE